MKILIVEDESKAGDYLKQGLREAGYAVDLVTNGVDGLHHGLERVLRGVDDISASRRSAARLPRLGLHLMLERFQINGSRQ